MELTSLPKRRTGGDQESRRVLGELSRTAPKKEGGKVSSLLLHQCSQELVAFSRPLGGSCSSAPAVPVIDKDFVACMWSTQGLSPDTIKGYSSRAGVFLRWLPERRDNFFLVSLNDVDGFLASKAAVGWCSTTLAAQAQALRAFFSRAGIRGWCAPGISRGIRSPSIPEYDGLRKGPTWKEVRRLLQSRLGRSPRRFVLGQSYRCARSMRFAAVKWRGFA